MKKIYLIVYDNRSATELEGDSQRVDGSFLYIYKGPHQNELITVVNLLSISYVRITNNG